jgi:hypothetical protein
MSKRLLVSCVLLLGLAATAGAQVPPTTPPGTRNVETDPIRCWWRTSTGAVRIGEQFDLTLTCAILETPAVRVVVDESRLGDRVIQFAPFEVVSGTHAEDIHSGMRRFFQYDYQLRIINQDLIGKDVAIPEIGLHYRVNSTVSGTTAVQGRDLLYFLPPQAIRVTSIVPDGAIDIRDSSRATFATIDELNFRSGLFNILAIALIAFGGLVVLLVLVRLARGSRKRTPAEQRVLSTGTLVGVATRALAEVKRERESAGWTDELAERALAATRVAASAAMGRTISQRTVAGDIETGEGRLMARGPRRGTRRIVSAPSTSYDVARYIARLSPADGRRATLEELREALATFGTAQYGRDGKKDESALDDALATATRAAGRVKGEHTFPRSLLRKWSAGGAPVESQA